MSHRSRQHIVEYPLTDKGNWRVTSELSDDELRLIGLVTVQWANLEHALYEISLTVEKLIGSTPNKAFGDISFDRRLRAFRDLAEHAPQDAGEYIRKLCDRIAQLKDDRHKITHGLWDWDRSNPEKLFATSFRPKYDFNKRFDKVKLQKLANQIGECTFNIICPSGSPMLESGVLPRPQEPTDRPQ